MPRPGRSDSTKTTSPPPTPVDDIKEFAMSVNQTTPALRVMRYSAHVAEVQS